MKHIVHVLKDTNVKKNDIDEVNNIIILCNVYILLTIWSTVWTRRKENLRLSSMILVEEHSVLSMNDCVFEVLATTGDTHLSSEDFGN